MTNSIDIKAKAPFPAGALSNFAQHAFTFDGIACASMEGLLQSLKVEDAEEQVRICGLAGAEAQGRGRQYDWQQSGTLFWRGEAIDRLSDAYQDCSIGPSRPSMSSRRSSARRLPPRGTHRSRIRLATTIRRRRS